MKHELDLSMAAPKQRISGQYGSSKAFSAKVSWERGHQNWHRGKVTDRVK